MYDKNCHSIQRENFPDQMSARHCGPPRLFLYTNRLFLRQVRKILTALAFSLISTNVNAGPTLDHIKSTGILTCGVGTGVAGFAAIDGAGHDSGFDVDICRAIAAAIFGAPEKVKFVPIDTAQRFLQSTEVDVVLRGLTWTFSREVGLDLRFGPVVFYDGQAFLVPKKLRIGNIKQLSRRSICVSSVANALGNLSTYFRRNKLALKAVVFDKEDAAWSAFRSGRCSAYSTDASELATALLTVGNPSDYSILPTRISNEPLAPLLRREDDQFFDIVRWTIFALINAEELKITSKNVEKMSPINSEPDVTDLLFNKPNNSGLDSRWVYHVIKSVGNYGEIYERNLGAKSSANLQRGLNRLWTDGGLLYAPPMR